MKREHILFLIFLVIVLFLIFMRFPKKSFMGAGDPYHIVVARYKENPWSWLSKDDPYVKIYNKGPVDDIQGKKLPNIGREAHTYLTYIVDNYDTLPDVVFFTQGSPDHTDGHPIEYFTNITGNCSENYVTVDIGTGLDENLHRPDYGNEVLYAESLDFKSWMKKNLDTNLENEITFYKGATFSVKRECILSRPLDFYKKILSLVPEHPSPEIAHYFERAWWYIFTIPLEK